MSVHQQFSSRDLVTPDDLSIGDLLAAFHHGELRRLGECFIPADLPSNAQLRAESIGFGVEGFAVLDRVTAAWVHGALDELPEVHTLAVRHGERASAPRHTVIDVREAVFVPADVITIGRVRVTTPLRTAVDVARLFPDIERAVLGRLLKQVDAGINECIALLDRGKNLPGKRAARERLVQALTESGRLT